MSDITPVEIERKLRALVNELAAAQLALQKARDAEVAAKHEYLIAYRRAWFHPDCPKPSRGIATVADREAWCDAQAFTEQQALDLAEVARKSAEDYLRTLRDQAVIVATLAKSVNTAYGMAGSL
jgi:hypothetical protein